MLQASLVQTVPGTAPPLTVIWTSVMTPAVMPAQQGDGEHFVTICVRTDVMIKDACRMMGLVTCAYQVLDRFFKYSG